jgi:hypothetical protein
MKRAAVLFASVALSWVTTLSLAAGGAAPQTAAETAAQQTLPAGAIWATWITRDIQIPLQGLPKTYSCDQLWYKLHGILLAIGARAYMAITPYNCGSKAAAAGRSPTLDLKFQTLRALTGADAHWAQAGAARKVVRLAPGEPKILDASDCALVAQLNGTLFTYLDMHVVSADLECSAPQPAQNFSVAVETLIAVPTAHSPA